MHTFILFPFRLPLTWLWYHETFQDRAWVDSYPPFGLGKVLLKLGAHAVLQVLFWGSVSCDPGQGSTQVSKESMKMCQHCRLPPLLQTWKFTIHARVHPVQWFSAFGPPPWVDRLVLWLQQKRHAIQLKGHPLRFGKQTKNKHQGDWNSICKFFHH